MTLTLQGNGTLNGLTVLGAPVTTLANTGTAASPSLVFDGDSDTGLFRPGANQIALSVGGSARLTIASNGTTTFTNLETSTGSLTFGDYSSITASSAKIWNNNSYGLYINGTGDSTHTAVAVYKVDATAEYKARIFHDGSAKFAGENFDLASYGALSIKRTDSQPFPLFRWGTTDSYTGGGIYPDGSSTFAGDAQFGTGAADARITIGSHGTAGTNNSVHVRADSANLLFMSGSAGVTKFEQNGTQRLLIDSDGNVIVGASQATNAEFTIRAAAPQLSLYATPGNVSRITFGDTDDWNIGQVYYDNDTNKLYLYTNNDDRMVIDNSGNVGIGTTSPEEILHVAAASEAVSNRDGVMFESTSALAADTGLPLVFTSHIGTQANYGVASIAGRKENAISGEAGGYLQFATGNSSGAISEKVRILSSGGITFNGDTATANALDDYEEGFWTPTINSGSAPGSTLTVNRARYIKNGTQCTIWCELVFEGGDGGNFRLQGMPYNAVSTGTGGGQTGAGMSSVGPVLFSNLNITGVTSIKIYIFSNILYFYYTPGTDGATWDEIHGNEVGGNTNGGNLIFSLSYYVG